MTEQKPEFDSERALGEWVASLNEHAKSGRLTTNLTDRCPRCSHEANLNWAKFAADQAAGFWKYRTGDEDDRAAEFWQSVEEFLRLKI